MAKKDYNRVSTQKERVLISSFIYDSIILDKGCAFYYGKETISGGVQAASGSDDQLHL